MNTSPRRSGARTRSARLSGPFVVLALAAALSSCGDDPADDTATDPAGSTSTPSPSETPTETPSEEPTEVPEEASGGNGPIEAVGSAGITEAQLVSQTEGGGSVSEMAFALDTDQAVADFVIGLENGFDATVTDTVAQVRRDNPDATPYGAVVSLGCDAPRDVAIDAGEAGFTVLPKLPKNGVQCLAPITFVVVFAAPDA